MTATMEAPHKHELKAGEVCNHCSLRAPPEHRCRMCTRVVPDWPVDEIGHLLEHGWTIIDGLWTEPLERVLRSPTPEMIAEVMGQVAHCEALLANKQTEYWRNDKIIAEEIRKGLEKSRTRLASLRAGERFPIRPQQRLSQQSAVQAEYIRRHEFNPKTIDRVVPAYTEEWLARRVKEALLRHKATAVMYLPQHERDTIEDRKEARITVHHAMCSECRQY